MEVAIVSKWKWHLDFLYALSLGSYNLGGVNYYVSIKIYEAYFGVARPKLSASYATCQSYELWKIIHLFGAKFFYL